MSSVRDKICISLAGLLFMTAIYMVFVCAPTERVMGPIQKIFYFHLSCALVAFLSFFTAFVSGIVYLIKKDLKIRTYLENLLKKQRSNPNLVQFAQSNKIKTEYQDQNQNLIRKDFRPSNQAWQELLWCTYTSIF